MEDLAGNDLDPRPTQWTYTVETSRIAFTSSRDGNPEIYGVNPDGSGLTRLTNNAAEDAWPAVSRDASKIAFASNRDGNYEIYVMNVDGTGQTRLTNNTSSDRLPAFSPDGSKIAFTSTRDGNYEIYSMNANGTGQTRLTNSAYTDEDPAFSPDGTRIVYASDRNWSGVRHIWVMNSDGTGATQLTDGSAEDVAPAYSPDGTKIAFASFRDGNWEIYVMNPDGTSQTRITSVAGPDESPSFSPNGSKIVFASNRAGASNYEIYVMNADGTGTATIASSSSFDWHPSWGGYVPQSNPPTAVDLAAASDTGVANGDNITNLDNSAVGKRLQFTVSGTVSGATVTLYADGTALGSAVASGTSTTVYTNGAYGLGDGTHDISARQVEPGKFESAYSAALSVVIDTLPPVTPPALDLQASSDSGVSDNDGITKDTTPTFDVAAAPYFRIYRNLSQISGDYESGMSYTATAQSDGMYDYTVSALDAAGNESARSNALNVSIDTDAPFQTEQIAKLRASDGAAEDYFGYSVAISGSTAIIGTRYDDDNGLNSGSAYIFEDTGSGWAQVAKLIAGDGAEADYFGHSVAISGTTAIVGAYGDDDNGSLSGAAYIFENTGSGWTQTAKLTASDGAADDYLGYSVGISGDVVIVGAWGDDDSGVFSGSAYIFEDTGSGWTEVAKLTASDASSSDEFGYSVSISGSTAIIGAQYDSTSDYLYWPSGSAYIFEDTGSGWAQVAKLTGQDSSQTAEFGHSVSVSGSTAIVGAIGDDAAYVFEDTGSTWTRTAKLGAIDGEEFDRFGGSVSISGNMAMVGAYFNGVGGAAYLFVDVGPGWSQQVAKLTASDAAAGDYFGCSVSISGSTAVAGAYREDAGSSDAGSAYVFSLPVPPPDLQAASDTGVSHIDDITRDATPAFDLRAAPYFRFYRDGAQISGDYESGSSYTAASHADGVYNYQVSGVDAAGNESAKSSALRVTIDTEGPREGQEIGKLLASDGAVGDWLGQSVAVSGSIALVGAGGTDQTGSASGSAYLYSATTGKQLFKLTASDAATGAVFGGSVAISGNAAIVGAAGADGDRGSAYVFDVRTGNQVRKLTAFDAAPFDWFGCSVGISGNLDSVAGSDAIVGAEQDDDAGTDSGSAYLFDVRTGTWRKLTASDAAAGDSFGSSVAISDFRAIVGADGDDDGGSNSGSAYLYDVSTGNELLKLTASDPAAGDWFGNSVAISGSLAIVGAHGDDDNGLDSGSAYVFEDTGSGWTQVAKLTASDGAENDYFGYSVAINGSTAIVGAYYDDNKGSAYVFQNTGSGWTEIAKLTASDGSIADAFGYSVTISGSTAIVGAWLDDDNGDASGSAYHFHVTPRLTRDTGIDPLDRVTSDTTPQLTFTFNEAVYYEHSDVRVLDPNAAPVTPDSITSWRSQSLTVMTVTFATPLTVDGEYTLTLNGTSTITDAAGNPLNDGADVTVKFTLNTAAPAPPTAPDLQAASDSGVSDTDDITNDNTPTFDVSATPYFRVYRDGTQISGDYESGSSYTLAAQADGTYDYQVTVVDGGGNESALSAALSVTIDTVSSVPPAAVDLRAASDSGVSDTDNVTNDNTPAFDFSAAPYFRFYRNGAKISGDYEMGSSYTLPAHVDGAYDYQVAAVDAAGNESPRSTALGVTIDTVGPRQRERFAKLLASDGAAGDWFGISVSISGSRAIVGARYDDDHGDSSGAAYVFEHAGAGWTQVAKLTASDGAAGDWLGGSVSISGGTAVVGATSDDDNGSNSGSAYVFQDTGSGWIQVAKLTASDGAAGDAFGQSVAISGQTVIVGAYYDDDNGSDSGSVYIFENTGSGWSEVAKLTASDSAAQDCFGSFVSIDGGRAIVGASGDDDLGSFSGSAYVFEHTVSGWTQVAKLTASDGAALDVFGCSVSISGGKAIVGTSLGDSAYVFENVGSGWAEVAKLTASDGMAGDRFGGRVSISGNTAIVGADSDDDHGSDSGAAYIFEDAGSGWMEVAKLTASDGAASDYFGGSVAISDGMAIVGAEYDDDQGVNSGSVYYFDVTPQLVLDTGANPRDRVTSDTTPELRLTFTEVVRGQNSDVTALDPNAGPVAPDSVVGWGSETLTIMFSTPLTVDGEYRVKLDGTSTITDVAGNPLNDGSDATITFTLDSTPPTAPPAPDLEAASDSGVSETDNITSDTTPAFSVHAAPYFRFYRDGDRISGDYERGSTHALPAQPDGTYDYQVTVVDIAGNESALGPALRVTVDTASPPAPSAPDLQAASDTGFSDIDNITNDVTPTLDVSAAPYFRFYVDGTKISGDYESGSSYALAAQTHGEYKYSVTAVDAAGNESAEGVALTVSVDTRGPRLSGQVAKLVASDGAAYDYFGHSVAIGGSTAIVGARYDDDKGRDSGSAYILEDRGSGWTQVAKLTANDGATEDFFGHSVSLDGGTAIVGAYGDDDYGYWLSGSAYIFKDSGSGWTQVTRLIASDPGDNAFFGGSVAISGSTAIVGASGDDENGYKSGAAYIFQDRGWGWTRVAKLTASDGAAQDWYGVSVSISGSRAIVGAHADDDQGTDSGSAYIFEDTGSGWIQVAKLTASDGAAGDGFGLSVSISGSTAIVGARADDDRGNDSGSAYIFQDNGSGWTQVAKLTAGDGAPEDNFGHSVSISGSRAIVGAWYDDDNGSSSGSAYLFENTTSGWLQLAKLTARDGGATDYLGTSVAISDGTAVVGASGDDDGGYSSGSAYVFDIPLQLTDDTGASPTDRLTDDTTPELTCTFSEEVYGQLGDVTGLDPHGSGVTPDSVTGWGSETLTVTFATPLTVDGLYTVILDGTTNITDAAGNPLNDGADETVTFTLDATAPTVTARVPSPGSTINTASCDIDVTISEPVFGVDVSDLLLSGTAKLAGTSVGAASHVAGNTWRFPVTGLGDGTLQISLAPDADDIEDVAGNDLAPDGWSFNVDLLPTVIDRTPAPGATLNSPDLSLDITFSEPVQGVDADDLLLTGAAAAGATVAEPTNPNGNTWRFPLSGLSTGTLDVSLAPDAGDIQDLTGNDLANITWSYSVDITPPTVTNCDPTPGSTIVGWTVNFDVAFSEEVEGVDGSDLVLTGTAAVGASVGTPTHQGGNTWRFPVSRLKSGDLFVTLAPDPHDIQDLAGNDLAVVSWEHWVHGPLDHFQWTTVSSPKYEDFPFSTTVTAQDSLGYTVTSYAGTAQLSGHQESSGSVTIGTGTSTFSYPLHTSYDDSRTQVIYLQSELGAATTITGLALNLSTLPGQTLNNWTIRMKHTPLSSYATASLDASGWTTVYQANRTISATGWTDFVFSTPFVYNGTNHLLVDFSHNNTSASSTGYVRSTVASTTRTAYGYSNSVYGDPRLWTGTTSPSVYGSTYVPNVRLTTSTVSVPIAPTAATFAAGVWTGDVTVLQTANAMVLRADSGAGQVGDSNTFEVQTLTLSVDVPAAGTEGDAPLTGTVAIPGALVVDLVVSLASDDTSELTVPGSVTIAAGQTSAAFEITIQEDTELDLNQTVTITATADHTTTGSDTITVQDNETAVLTVSLPDTATEGDGLLLNAGTVTVSSAATADAVVQLRSDDTSEIVLPDTVTIMAGQTTATFNVTVVNDTLIDGTQTAVVTTHVPNWTDGSDSMDVLDNDGWLMVQLPAGAWENAGTLSGAGRVTLGGTLGTALVVTLVSSDDSELQVPATVTVPAGQTTVTFDLTVVNDADQDGTQTVTVTAGAAGLAGDSEQMPIRDDELHHFIWGTISSPQTAGLAFTATLEARNVDDEKIVPFTGAVGLSGAGTGGAVPVTPVATGAFAGGAWSGSITVSALAAGVVLTAEDGRGNTGVSNAFDVVSGPLDHFAWSTIASPQYQDVPFAGTLTAQDARDYTVTNYSDTVELSGWTGSATTSHTVFNSPTHSQSYTGSSYYTMGYAFTPSSDILVTDVRHYFGSKVSIWSSTGTLLASASVSSTPGTWRETPLATPVQLSAGSTYRVAAYTPGQGYYYRTDMSSAFPHGTINGAYYRTGDGFPTSSITGFQWWLVGFRYEVGSNTAIDIAPTSLSLVNGVWTGNVTVLEEAADMYLRADDGSGHVADSNTFDVEPAMPLTVTVPEQATEGDGTLADQGTVSIPSSVGFDVVVTLQTDDTTEAVVPSTVTIAAGSTSATFDITIEDDAELDPVQTVTITASATACLAGTDTITVHDNETAALTVALPGSATEGDGTLSGAGTVTVSEPPAADVVVQLSSNDPSEVTVPATVTIPAGQTSATFDVTIVNDTLIDGPQTASVTAHVENWTDGTDSLDVLDNDGWLTVQLPAEAWEGAGTLTGVGSVTLGGTLTSNLVVTLDVDDTSELSVPAAVTVLAGQTTATFDVTVVDDTQQDGVQTATVTASASGLTGGSRSMLIRDNEVHHFTWGTIGSPKTAGVAFTAALEARNVDDEKIVPFTGTVVLSGAGTGGAVSVTPATTTAFTAGAWSGSVTVNAVATNVVLTADDGSGNAGLSNAFNVVSGPLDHFAWSTVASPQYKGLPFAATLTAQDVRGYTVTGYNGAVTLSGRTGGSGQVTIGTDTADFSFPLHTVYHDSRTQVIYLRSELGSATTITGLSLYVTTLPSPSLLNAWTIRMKHTTLSSYATPSLDASGWTTVYTANKTFSSTGWVNFVFTTQFVYNGTDNVLIDFSHNNSSWSSSGNVRSSAPGGTRTAYAYSDSGYGNPLNWSGTTSPTVSGSTSVPNVRLTTSSVSVPVTPASAVLAGGVWTGSVTVGGLATNMYLRADDGSGHAANSNTFDVAATPFDFGDAPSPYPTLLINNGPRHAIVSGLYLGAGVDAEGDGLPSAGATLDDTTGAPDDEDGVRFPTPLYLGRDATIEVTASAAGQLDAWIDWNDDGDWADTGEKVCDNLSLTMGLNTLTVAVPATATLTPQTFARFRLSSAGGLPFTGAASDGEIEDYAVAIELAPPVLDGEPSATPGSENTISWSAVPGAGEYFVQYDNHADFNSPEGDSGWITALQHTFTGLTDGVTYDYRARARNVTAGATGSWTQTAQAQFNTDTLTSVTATAGGDVVLAGGTGGSVYVIQNPGYENTAGWTAYVSDTQGIAAFKSSNWASEGTYSFGTSFWPDDVHATGDYSAFRQMVNWTGLATLKFDLCAWWANEARARLLIGGTEVWSVAPSGADEEYYYDRTVDVSMFTGSQQLELRVETKFSNSEFYAVFWDNLRTYATSGYVSSGNTVSTNITRGGSDTWGTLTFNKSVPTNTTLTVAVLPATGSTPITGYSNVTSGTSLSAITDTTIRLRADLTTTDTSVTPALNDWTVTWQAPDVYVESAWSHVEFSTQDATAPQVELVAPAMTDDPTPSVTVTATDANGIPDGTAVTIDVDLNNDGDFDDSGEAGYTLGALTGGTATFDVVPALAVGPHRLRARVADLAGNEGADTAPIVINTPPTAEAGGPYEVAEGAVVVLDASGSSDPDQATATLQFQWDLDGDGIYGETGAPAEHGDELGMNPTFAVGALDGPGSYPVALRVTDDFGMTSTDTATVHVTNVPPTAGVSGPASGLVAKPYEFTFSAVDPSAADMAATFQYVIDWGDGQGTTVSGPAGGVTSSHFYTDFGNYTLSVTATDKDGGGCDPALHAFAIPRGTGVTITAGDFGGDPDDEFVVRRSGDNVVVTLDGITVLDTALAPFGPGGSGLTNLTLDAGEGNDSLTVDHAAGGFFSLAITFHGGPAAPAGGDSLMVVGGDFTTVTHTLTTLSPAHSGQILYDTGTQTASITYTGLEPVLDGSAAVDRVFAFTAGAETVTLSAPGDGGLANWIDSDLSEKVSFNNPSGSLTIDVVPAGHAAGPDAVFIEGLDSAFDANLIVTGGSDDTLTFQAAGTNIGAGNLNAMAGAIAFLANFATHGNAVLTALAGSVTDDADDGAANVTANHLTVAVAGTGNTIGGGEDDRLEINAAWLDASTAGAAGDGIFVADTAGGLQVGLVNAGAGAVSLSVTGGSLIGEASDPGVADIVGGAVKLDVLTTGFDLGVSEAARLEIAATTLAASTMGAVGDDVFLVDTEGGLGLNHVDAGSGDVFLTAADGPLTDANAESPNLTAGRAALVATGGIGSGGALETAVAQLAASNAGSGNIELANTGALAIVTIGGTSGVTSPASVALSATGLLAIGDGGGQDITAAGTADLNAAGVAEGTGSIVSAASLRLQGTGAFSLPQLNLVGTLAADVLGSVLMTDADDIRIGNVLATAGIATGAPGDGGFVTINATSGTITVDAAVNTTTGTGGGVILIGSVVVNNLLTAGAGTITLHAKESADTDLMINGPVQATGSGSIAISANHDVLGLATGGLTSDGGAITITADADGSGSAGDRGTIQLAGDIVAGTGTVTLSLADCDGRIDGNVVSAGNLAKNGGGALRLNGMANSYAGTTDVNAGTLLVNGSLTADTGTVTVHSGATLGGGGTIGTAAGARDVVVESGGFLAPGDVDAGGCVSLAGRLTVNGDVDLQAGATFQVQLGGLVPGVDYDQLKVNGDVDLTGLLDGSGGSLLDVSLTFVPGWGSLWRIVDNDDVDAIETRFNGLKECAFVWLGGTLANITYAGSDGTPGDGHNDVLLTVAGRFDFDGFYQYTAATYTSVSPFQEKRSTNSFGWVALPPQYFERNWPQPPPYTSEDGRLRYDGQSTDGPDTPLTFQVDVVPGQAYEVAILTGDALWNHDQQRFWAYDSAVGPGVYQDVDIRGAGGEDYRIVRFTTGTIGEWPLGSGHGQISVRMQDLGGVDPAAVILGLDVRPVQAVGILRLSRADGQPPATPVPADGTTPDVYDGWGAPPSTLLTITSTAGTILTADADPGRWSTQVLSEADGTFRLTLQRPTGETSAELMVEETSGMARGTLTQAYEPPTEIQVERYDFGVSGGPLQTNPDFLEVVPQTIYSTTRGYGWASRVAGVNRKDPNMSDLRTDLNYAASATFRVNVTAAAEYHVRIYHANPKYNGTVSYVADNFDVWAEGVFQYNVPSVAAGGTEIREFTITPGADGTPGTLDIRFWDRGGQDGNFVVSGIEIWTGSGTPPDLAPLLVGQWPAGADRGSVAAVASTAVVKLDAATLAPIVAEATARWSAVGLTPAQSSALSETQFAVADLGGSYLGLADVPAYRALIDDDAAGRGWGMKAEGGGRKDELPEPQTLNSESRTLNPGIDLLTVVMHELGHLLGYEHSADGLMAPVLSASSSRIPYPATRIPDLATRIPDLATRIPDLATRIPDLASRTDDVFAELGRDSSEGASAMLSESQDTDVPPIAAVTSGDEATQARVPRRNRLQGHERDLDACLAELSADEAAVSGGR